MVPGKEFCSDAQLLPHIVLPTGEQELVEIMDLPSSATSSHSISWGFDPEIQTPNGCLPLCTWVERDIVGAFENTVLR